jgi:hypothetical protein
MHAWITQRYPMRRDRAWLALPLVVSVAVLAGHAAAATATLPPRTIPVPIKDMLLPVPVGGELSYATQDGRAAVQGRLTGDLASAQQQSTALLRALIDRDSACGDRIAVKDARIGARAPALRVTGNVAYERIACVAGRQMVVVPRSPVFVDLLLHPLVQPRSLRVRTEVLEMRAANDRVPAPVVDALRQAFAHVVDDRIGELFPQGIAPSDLTLQSVVFEEAQPGRLVARVEGAGSLPQAVLDRLLRGR